MKVVSGKAQVIKLQVKVRFTLRVTRYLLVKEKWWWWWWGRGREGGVELTKKTEVEMADFLSVGRARKAIL